MNFNMNEYKNPNGTYNGAKFFSTMTGLEEQEIVYMFERMKQLKALNYSTEEAKEIIREELKTKPWENK